jgi:hypothetical protein
MAKSTINTTRLVPSAGEAAATAASMSEAAAAAVHDGTPSKPGRERFWAPGQGLRNLKSVAAPTARSKASIKSGARM